MKYSTSPPASRCHSPVPTEFSSSLPMPIVYRYYYVVSLILRVISFFYSLFKYLFMIKERLSRYRHNCIGAATKCYKYLRKLLKFEQMDFEFAVWQMLFLFAAPQKVYRNFQNRKRMYVTI